MSPKYLTKTLLTLIILGFLVISTNSANIRSLSYSKMNQPGVQSTILNSSSSSSLSSSLSTSSTSSSSVSSTTSTTTTTQILPVLPQTTQLNQPIKEQPKLDKNTTQKEVMVDVQKILRSCIFIDRSPMIPQCLDNLAKTFKDDVQNFANSITNTLVKGDPSIDVTRRIFTTLFDKLSEVNFMDGDVSVNCAKVLNDNLKSNPKLQEEIDNHKARMLNRPSRILGTSGNLVDVILSLHRGQGLIHESTYAYLNGNN